MTKHLKRAVKIAKSSDCNTRHGAVLVRGGRIIAEATNKVRFDPEIGDWRESHEHAEAAVCRIAGPRAKGCKLFVARVSATGKPALSKPCVRCAKVIEAAGVRRVVWTG